MNGDRTPLVYAKKDGSIRLCGDHKVTLNQCIKVEQYPLPKPEDHFHQLSDDKEFYILDLSHAYQQMRLTEKSQE